MTNTHPASRAIGGSLVSAAAAAIPNIVWKWVFGAWALVWALVWAFASALPEPTGWRLTLAGASVLSALIAFRAAGGAAAASIGGRATLRTLFAEWLWGARVSRFRAFAAFSPAAAVLIGAAGLTSKALASSANFFIAAGALLFAILGVVAGRAIAGDQRREWSTTEGLRARVAAVLGVPADRADFSTGDGGSSIIVSPVPASVVNHLADLEARLAVHLPGLEVLEATAGRIIFAPASDETAARRDVITASGGLVRAIEGENVTLAPGVGPASAEAVEAYLVTAGLDLVEWLPYEGRARVAELDPLTAGIRQRYADVLRVKPWDLELAVTMAGDDIENIALVRAPTPNVDADRRLATWRALVAVTPGGSAGWKIDEDYSGKVTLTYGEAPALPDRAARAALLPDTVTPSDWHNIPLGVGGDGQPVGLDLNLGPHALVVGPTGSGKTVELLQHITSALTRGHQVALIDPTKAGLDFVKIRPWVTVWADALPGAQAAIERIYAEVQRRKAVLQREECGKWAELPAAVREAENIRPMTVVIDEFGSLVLQDESAKSFPKGHPQRAAVEEENLARAVILSLTSRIAREARFAGVHLAIALQRPDASIISGELRANLTSAVQLAAPGKPLSIDALRMVFPGEAASEAYATLRALDDGHSRGLAVTSADGGRMAAFRVGYAAAAENPTLLYDRGVPVVKEPWNLTAPAPAAGDAPAPDFWS